MRSIFRHAGVTINHRLTRALTPERAARLVQRHLDKPGDAGVSFWTIGPDPDEGPSFKVTRTGLDRFRVEDLEAKYADRNPPPPAQWFPEDEDRLMSDAAASEVLTHG